MQGLIDNQQVSKHNLKSKFSIFQDDFLDFETALKYQVKIKAFKRQVEEAVRIEEEEEGSNLSKTTRLEKMGGLLSMREKEAWKSQFR